MNFEVTEKAMRPAGRGARQCYYCQAPIGEHHRPDCVLVMKKVRVRLTVDYEIGVPASWDKYAIEFHRNDGSWCSDNAVTELQALTADENQGCLCSRASFKYLESVGDEYLNE